MGDAGHMAIRRLRTEDLDFAQEVRRRAGWNQTRPDWERLLSCQPDGCFLLELDGRAAGTATTTVHGGEVGWIGMVLVHPDSRRRGCATRLLHHCIEFLRPRVDAIKLDATPAGRQVYEKLGFVNEANFHRWEGCPTIDAHGTHGDDEIPFDFSTWRDLDRQAFGAGREHFVTRLSRDSETVRSVPGRGFAMRRRGSHAWYLGPVVARDEASGTSLVERALAGIEGEPVYWDIPDANEAATSFAERRGFSRQRPLVRMRLGERGHEGDLALQWGIGGPETG